MHVRGTAWRSVQVVGAYPRLHIVNSDTGYPLAPFIPNTVHPHNMISGVMHRVGALMPKVPNSFQKHFTSFYRLFITTKQHPPTVADVMGFDEFMDSTSYNERIKDLLRKLREELTFYTSHSLASESHLKLEAHKRKYGVPRGINAHPKDAVVSLGPWMRAVDAATFRGKWFVKHMDPTERPEKMLDLLGMRNVIGTDFTSFEGHHTGVFAEATHFWMMHMLRGCNLPSVLRRYLSRMMKGTNKMRMKHMTAELAQALMSGAMHTSSANGELNLLILSWLAGVSYHRRLYGTWPSAEWLVENHDLYFTGLIEGDDGIFVDNGIEDDLIEEMGVKLKLDRYPNFGDASFCGVVCDPVALKCVTNPIHFMTKAFVVDGKYALAKENKKLALVRCSAMSAKYLCGDAPVVGPLCDRILYLTRGIDVRAVMSETDRYKRWILELALEKKPWKKMAEVGDSSRDLVERHFGMPISEQLEIERLISLWDGVKPLGIPLSHLLNEAELTHAQANVVEVEVARGLLNHPQPYLPDIVREVFSHGLKASVKSRVAATTDKEYETLKPLIPPHCT
jgi:hypothetical protein